MYIFGFCIHALTICLQRVESPMEEKYIHGGRVNVKGGIPFICRLLRFFSLKPVLVHLYPAQRALQRRRPGEVSKISLVAGRSQISIPLSLRGELAIAKKFGQYKQIKSGNCSVVTQSFHSLIYTVILHYPLIVTYTFHSPNMKDKYWIHLKLYHLPGWPAGQGKHFQRVLAAIYWSHSSERSLHPWNVSLLSNPRRKRSMASAGKCR